MSGDEDRTPMTRTELAMLWDLLGRWMGCHGIESMRPGTVDTTELIQLSREIDAELAERFGG